MSTKFYLTATRQSDGRKVYAAFDTSIFLKAYATPARALAYPFTSYEEARPWVMTVTQHTDIEGWEIEPCAARATAPQKAGG